MKNRAAILKTYKLFIGGKFVRSESGYYFRASEANVAKASRKDLRDAIKAARKTFPGWSGKTAYNRGQILYRIAEELEGRKTEFVEILKPFSKKHAAKEVEKCIDRLVWYAGWADKVQQVFGTVNPVALPYFNFTTLEATGVVGVVCSEDLPLLPLISKLAPAIVSGNTVVLLATEKFAVPALTLAEVIATSDVPEGVVNILTGSYNDLLPHLAKHMDVNAIDYSGTDAELLKQLQEEASANVKRIIAHSEPRGAQWFTDKGQSPYWIMSLTETKTTWHPIGV